MAKYFILLISYLFLLNSLKAQDPLVIGFTDSLNSQILKEKRRINIYLPEEYNQTDTVKYPVIYILDGGIEEDFIHIAGIVRYYTQPWVGKFPKSIVVGIENTNRKRDFTFSVSNLDFLEAEGFKKEQYLQYGKSSEYITFIQKELQPYIENKYKGNQNRTIIGESLAGLLATEILLKKPQLFNKYIIIAPSLWWGEQKLLKDATQLLKSNNNPLMVYLGVPNKQEDTKMYYESKKLSHILKKASFINLSFDYLPEESHATIIHQAVYNAFKRLNSKK